MSARGFFVNRRCYHLLGVEVERMRSPLIFFASYALVLVHPIVAAQSTRSPAYHQDVIVGANEKRLLRLTNDSESPIVAFVRVDFSTGLEGRTYYDAYVNRFEQPIAPGASLTFGLGPNLSKVQEQVRAIVCEDGTSAGDPAWINAIFATRIRLYDRLLSLHELLGQQVGTGISREGIISLLREAQANSDKQLTDDDLRVLDDTAFRGATSTFDANREASAEQVLKAYLKSLEERTAKLEHSQPKIERLRARLAERPDPSPVMPPLLVH
jgi:hypothetical protein